ncbi:MAG: GntP family permease [Burkholderiales bacterium]
MLGILGILVSLGLLIGLAYRGWNVILIAPLCALVSVLFALGDVPLLATYTQVYLPALGGYLVKFFPLFLLGAVFGKLMEDSGSARAIAHGIVAFTGRQRAMLAIVLACAILTYGGVSLFVVAFAVYPIALTMFREGDIPKRLIPATIGLGAFTFTMTALPGTPAIQNAIPMPFFGTTLYAAPGLGVIAAVIMLGTGLLWLNRRAASAASAGEGFGAGADAAVHKDDDGPVPPFAIAIAPVLVVLVLNFVLTNYVIPNMDTSYLAQAKYGKVALSAVAGIWAIVVAMFAACILVVLLNFKRLRNARETMNQGALGSMLPALNVASEVGYGAVIAGLAAFAVVRESLQSISSDPVISLAIIVNVLAGITGSASGGLSIALQAMGAEYLQQAQALGISPQILARVASLSSGGFDVLPHNGAVITLLAICGLTHKQSYFDMFMVCALFPVIATVCVIVLNAMFGTF